MLQKLQTRAKNSVQDARLDESSGLVASRRYPGCVWTHNDSGDSARAFLLSPQGVVNAVVNLQNAQARDWEDISYSNGYVYCGDIGDNNRERANVVIYRFREPQLPLDGSESSVKCEVLTLQYPDGAHDAETLIARRDGTLLIVSKDIGGSNVYASQTWRNGATQTMRKIGSYAFPFDEDDLFKGWRGALSTSGGLSPDGKRVTIITYTHAYEWTLPQGANAWSRVWQSKPRVFRLPKLKQSEGVCYSLDGKSWWLSSESTPMPMLQLAR